MLRAIDACAHTNRWHRHAGPVALFCAGLMACVLAAPPLVAGPLVWAVASVAAVVGARVPARLFFGSMLVPLGFLVTSALALCVTVGFEDGGLVFGLSAAGAMTALRAGLRAAGALAVTLCFACTVPTAGWMALLRRARVPEALLDLVMLVYRTLFVLDEARLGLMRALDNRMGFANARLALRSTARAAAALFLRSLQRAARLERGLAARGYVDRLPVLPPQAAASRGGWVLAVAVPVLVGAAAFVLAGALGA
ncbi:Cobalt ECF transporter T component CbiQ [Rhodovastum atsumiense]|nr:CbiQ family ECF transporter T component [Rhodovastum atsumiense]CAH2601108.1 Cobalt ECF transporter T component CbiQ [Rhodovastum atsumiense]